MGRPVRGGQSGETCLGRPVRAGQPGETCLGRSVRGRPVRGDLSREASQGGGQSGQASQGRLVSGG